MNTPEGWECGEASLKGEKVVICLGNRYMGDDGLGTVVGEELEKLAPDVLVDVCQTLDFSLLFRYRGASEIVVVDTLASGKPPGTVSKYKIAPREIPLESLPSQHALRIHDLFDFAREAGVLNCPLTIFGVEPRACRAGEGLSEEVRRAVPSVTKGVMEELGLAPVAGPGMGSASR